MALATITTTPNGGLHVERDGYEWRRVNGQWEMLGDSGKWFASDIQDHRTAQQVADYEYCLRPYAFEDGPSYPKGRKRGESVGAFIRRVQLAELRKDAKNIFAPVPMRYTPNPDNERAAHIRTLTSRPMPDSFFGRSPSYTMMDEYNDRIAAQRAARRLAA